MITTQQTHTHTHTHTHTLLDPARFTSEKSFPHVPATLLSDPPSQFWWESEPLLLTGLLQYSTHLHTKSNNIYYTMKRNTAAVPHQWRGQGPSLRDTC